MSTAAKTYRFRTFAADTVVALGYFFGLFYAYSAWARMNFPWHPYSKLPNHWVNSVLFPENFLVLIPCAVLVVGVVIRINKNHLGIRTAAVASLPAAVNLQGQISGIGLAQLNIWTWLAAPLCLLTPLAVLAVWQLERKRVETTEVPN